MKGSDFAAMADQVRPNLPGLERAVFFETPAWDEMASGGASAGAVRAAGRELYSAETFDPGATLRACAQQRCIALYGVPAMFIAELADPGFAGHDLSSLRTGIMAGAPCPVEVMKKVGSQMGIGQISIAFGQTETSPASTVVRVDDTVEHAARRSAR